MPPSGPVPRALLTGIERALCLMVGFGLVAVAGWLVLDPPERVVAARGCAPGSGQSCRVTVDADLSTLAAVMVALGVVAILIGILGSRFTKAPPGT